MKYNVKGIVRAWLDYSIDDIIQLIAMNPNAGASIDYTKGFRESVNKDECVMGFSHFDVVVEAENPEDAEKTASDMLKCANWEIVSTNKSSSGNVTGYIRYVNYSITEITELSA
jgi:hypothetical protein